MSRTIDTPVLRSRWVPATDGRHRPSAASRRAVDLSVTIRSQEASSALQRASEAEAAATQALARVTERHHG